MQVNKKRNIGIIAHIDAGKTTTTERILYYSGKEYKMGEVHEGSTTMDYMDQERERGITITSAATKVKWFDYIINIIDTPGHIDFSAEVERTLRVLDGVVILFCGVAGVEAQSETVWRQADRYNIPKIAFINKLDRIGSDFERSVESIKNKLKANAVPIQIPYGKEKSFNGIIDLIKLKTITYENKSLGKKFFENEIPETYLEKALEAREKLIEKVSDYDDSILEKFVNHEEISNEELIKAIRSATLSSNFVPVLCGSALKNKGVQQLLDAVCYYLPSPIDIPEIKGINPKNKKVVKRKIGKKEPLTALAFKSINDKYGQLTFVRIYCGKLKVNDQGYNPRTEKVERIQRLFVMHAKSREEVKEIEFGDIGAVIGLKNTITGDTICPKNQQISLEVMKFPEPVISMSIEPKTTAEKDRLNEVLEKIISEDPTLTLTTDEETDQQIISGMGELHLEVKKEQMLREFNIEAKFGKPSVSYKETIIDEYQQEYEFEKQIGGKNQYAKVKILVAPNPEQTKPVFENKVAKDVIPLRFISSIKDGALAAAYSGGNNGFPLINLKMILIDGVYDSSRSTEIAFETAISIACKKAVEKTGTKVLEPIMRLEIMTPEEYLGEIVNDLTRRRAQIQSIDDVGNIKMIEGFVPLAEVFGYTTNLRSLSQGRASATLEPCKYATVPDEIAKRLFF